VSVLEGEYLGGLSVAATRSPTGVITGTLSGDLDITGGDADAQAAFGNDGGELDQLFTIASGFPNLCGVVVNCPVGLAASDWLSFTGNPTSDIIRLPEPASLLLLGLGMAGLLFVGRRRP
jgi:hypothetical protein